MSQISGEDELAGSLAVVACGTLLGNDPFVTLKQSGLDEVIHELTEQEKDKLLLENLVFDIFCVSYSCQLFNLSNEFLHKYHLYVYKLISENTKVLQIIRNSAFSKLSEFGDRVEMTREALLQAFEHEILRNRYSQYSGALGGVRYPIDEHSRNRFGLVVGKNMFGEKPEQIVMGSLYANVRLGFFAGFVGETIAKQEKQSSDTIESDQQVKVPEKPKQEKQSDGFWRALLFIIIPVILVLCYQLFGGGENKNGVEYSSPNTSTEQVEDEVGYNQDSYEAKAPLEAVEPEKPIEKETSKTREEILREIAYSLKPKEESTSDSIDVSSVDYLCNLYSKNRFAVGKEYLPLKSKEVSGKIEKFEIPSARYFHTEENAILTTPSYSPTEQQIQEFEEFMANTAFVGFNKPLGVGQRWGNRQEGWGCKHNALLFFDSSFRTEKTSHNPELWRKAGWYGVAVLCKCIDQEKTNLLGVVSAGSNLIINGVFSSVDLDYRVSEDRTVGCLIRFESCSFKIE